MSTWDDYKYESGGKRMEPGDYRVEIVDVEETTSKSSGNPMIVVTVTPNGSNMRIKHYIVKNEHFNRNMSSLFDSFGIAPGDFNFLTWVGAVGAARLKEDERGYLKVQYFLSPKKAESLPPWDGPMPQRQTVTEIAPDAPDEEEFPWA